MERQQFSRIVHIVSSITQINRFVNKIVVACYYVLIPVQHPVSSRSIKIFLNHTGTIKDLFSDLRGKHELFDHKYSTSKQNKQVLPGVPGKETMFKLPKIKMPDVKGTIKKVKDSTVNATKKATDAVRDQAKKANPFKKNK